MKKIVKKFNLVLKIFILFLIVFVFKINTTSFGYKIENTNINYVVDLNTMALKINENESNKLYKPIKTFEAELTGYVYNCPLCTGRLACLSSLDLSGGLTTFKDSEYGNVKIIAVSRSHLPCGSIIKFFSPRISNEEIIGIVLDRGMPGIDIDILVESEDYALGVVGRSKVKYDVLRMGYPNES